MAGAAGTGLALTHGTSSPDPAQEGHLMVLAEIIGWDIVIVLAIIALLFGGAKLPKLSRSLGSAKGEFEKGLKEGESKASDTKGSGKTADSSDS